MGTHCAQLNYGRCGITLAAGGVVEEHEKGRGTCLIHYEDTVQKQIKRITAETKDPAGAAVLLIRKRRNDVDASTLFAFERVVKTTVAGFGRGDVAFALLVTLLVTAAAVLFLMLRCGY